MWGNDRILYHKTNKEAWTVLCSVVKHLGSGRALKKWGKTLDFVSCFPLHFFRAPPLPVCFTTEQSTVEASLFVKYICACVLGSITSRCSGKEPALLPRRHGWMREDSFVSPSQSVNRPQIFVGHTLSRQLGLRPGMADDVELMNVMRKNFRDS